MDTQPKQDAASKPPSRREELRQEILELVKMAALFLIIFFGLRTFVIEGYQVQGDSMLPILEDGERILVLKLPHQLSQLSLFRGLQPLAPGNLVVFDSRDEENKRYIKRVIAAGSPSGDGNMVEAGSAKEDNGARVSVEFAGGKVFVDNVLQEEPYLVPEERDIMEHVKTELKSGEYYVLGDHRSVSKDSRSFGAVTSDQIIGRAWLCFWPLNKFSLL